MSLQQKAVRARNVALVLVFGGAAVGCLTLALLVRHYTRAPTPKGTP